MLKLSKRNVWIGEIMKIEFCCDKMGIAVTDGSVMIFARVNYAPPNDRKIREVWIKGNESEQPVKFCPYRGNPISIKVLTDE